MSARHHELNVTRLQGGGQGKAILVKQCSPPGKGGDKIAFVTCSDKGFLPGALGTMSSIRKFYAPEEADILIFFDGGDPFLEDFCVKYQVEIHRFSEIDAWASPMIYSLPRYANDTSHFYHPKFTPHPRVPCTNERPSKHAPFGRVHHTHPLNVKAYCTAFCLNVRGYDKVVHIDSDAFLLSRIDHLFAKYDDVDTVIGFDDSPDGIANSEALLGFEKASDFTDKQFCFNAGIVLYRNGPILRELMLEFMFYIDSCYHYTAFENDQGLLRSLVCKYVTVSGLRFHMENGVNYNPTWNRADRLEFIPVEQAWYNQRNGLKQFMWHAAGQKKLWTGQFNSESVNAAWQWIGGTYEKAPEVPCEQ